MKTLFSFRKGLMIAAAITSIIGLQSCLDDDDNNYYQLNVPNALVTVKPIQTIHSICNWMTVPRYYR